jgi:hypothetical protein
MSSHAAMDAACGPELWIVYLRVRVISFMQIQYQRSVPGRGQRDRSGVSSRTTRHATGTYRQTVISGPSTSRVWFLY